MSDLDTEGLSSKEAELIAQEAAKYMNVIATTPLQQLGEMIGDRFRIWRYKQAINLLLDVKKYHVRKGIKVREIPVKTLLPILENASLEEDEALKNKWTALLINATDESNSFDLHNVCTEILRQLSAIEVKVLDKIYDELKEVNFDIFDSKVAVYILKDVYKQQGKEYDSSAEEQEKIIVSNLIRLGLIEYTPDKGKMLHKPMGAFLKVRTLKEWISLTDLGRRFVKECKVDG